MIKRFLLVAFILTTSIYGLNAQGLYLQWGYNTEWFTKSNISVTMSNGDKFKLHNAKAHDKPDLKYILKAPLDISIPQYNYRIGYYLNQDKTRAIELNFDHIKYVVTDGQDVHVTGTINEKAIDENRVMDPKTFMHLEHTDGGNLLHLNYVMQNSFWNRSTTAKRGAGMPIATFIRKIGAGINIPRTDFTYMGDRLNNKFHIAGYNVSAEAGARLYALPRLFLEGTAKTGYVRYVNALANTTTSTGNRVHHGFGYFEVILMVGYDINWGGKKKSIAEQSL